MEPHMIQGSESWKKYRQSRISSTDAATILGVNSWCSPYMLWQRKLGLLPEQEENEAMRQGKDMEEEARQKFMDFTGINVSPQVVIHRERDWQMSSLDGLDYDGEIAVEIKCSQKYLEMIIDESPSEYVIAQCQHHISVLEIPFIYLFGYWHGRNCLIKIERDQAYIDQLIEKEQEFYRCLTELDPPPLTDKDIVQRDDTQWQVLAHLWQSIQGAMKELEKHQEEVRKQLIEMAGNSPSEGAGLRVTPYMRKGSVEYGKVRELKGIDLEPYRKGSTICWRLQCVDDSEQE